MKVSFPSINHPTAGIVALSSIGTCSVCAVSTVSAALPEALVDVTLMVQDVSITLNNKDTTMMVFFI